MSLLAFSIALTAGCSTKQAERTLVVVSNEDSGDVTLVDPSRDEVVRTIAVGERPRGMRVSPDGKLLFVALSGAAKAIPSQPRPASDKNKTELAAGEKDVPDAPAGGIGVVDLDRGELVRVIAAGRDPETFDITPDGHHLYVSNADTAAVSVVDVATGRVVRSISVGSDPDGVTIARDGERVYVTSESENAVDVISIAEHRVIARLPTSSRPRAVALNGAGSEAYVTAELGGKLHLIDTRTYAPAGDIPTGGNDARPMGVVLSPDGVRAFVTNGRAGSVAVIDLRARKVVRLIEHVGSRPWGLALTPDAKKLYVAAGPDLAVIDPSRGTVEKRIPVGRGPWGVVVARRNGTR